MKAVILSDSHGMVGNMVSAVENEKNIDMIMFAGDVHADIEELGLIYPRMCIAEVIGNNDFFVKSVPEDRVFTFGGKKILLTHGHKYGVRYSTAQLLRHGRSLGADVCIYGHTHSRDFEEVDGITVINPGTAARGYAVLTIENDEIKVEFKDL